jgi:hypothetical protein
MIRMFIPERDLDFLPVPEARVKKAPDPGSATLTETEYAVQLHMISMKIKFKMIKSNNLQ